MAFSHTPHPREEAALNEKHEHTIVLGRATWEWVPATDNPGGHIYLNIPCGLCDAIAVYPVSPTDLRLSGQEVWNRKPLGFWGRLARAWKELGRG